MVFDSIKWLQRIVLILFAFFFCNIEASLVLVNCGNPLINFFSYDIFNIFINVKQTVSCEEKYIIASIKKQCNISENEMRNINICFYKMVNVQKQYEYTHFPKDGTEEGILYLKYCDCIYAIARKKMDCNYTYND